MFYLLRDEIDNSLYGWRRKRKPDSEGGFDRMNHSPSNITVTMRILSTLM